MSEENLSIGMGSKERTDTTGNFRIGNTTIRAAKYFSRLRHLIAVFSSSENAENRGACGEDHEVFTFYLRSSFKYRVSFSHLTADHFGSDFVHEFTI